MNKKLEWEDKYSVGVQLIDNQHKSMFDTINLLIDMLSDPSNKGKLDEVIKRLVEYKRFHFATEEKYFDEFNYVDAEEHRAKHREFNDKLEEMVKKNEGDSMSLAYELVDFLEDWLLDHLMVVDQKYVSCFHEHGLK